jgi:HK97 family phage portal protein
LFKFIKRLFSRKTMPPSLSGGQWSGTAFTDSYKRNRAPTANELMAELKGVAWTCATLNAAACASNPPILYVGSKMSDNAPKCKTRKVNGKVAKSLYKKPHLRPLLKTFDTLDEVTDHPLLDLLYNVNPIHNQFDLFELTTLYQEVHGSAYWYLDLGPLGTPEEIWILPSQNITPIQAVGSKNIVDYYEHRTGTKVANFPAECIIHFRYPDPRDPYKAGMSPLRAAFEDVSLVSSYAAFKSAKLENRAIPDALISPDEVIGEEERDRMEAQWNQKFRKGGAGRVLISEGPTKIQLLSQSMGDVAQLAEMGKTKEDIANAFHVPLAFLSTNTNLANLQAADYQHLSKAINPRLQRRDEKMNEQLVPLFDPTGRLFLASEDPSPLDPEEVWQTYKVNMQYGVVTINEARDQWGLPWVPWGERPYSPIRPSETPLGPDGYPSGDAGDDQTAGAEAD